MAESLWDKIYEALTIVLILFLLVIGIYIGVVGMLSVEYSEQLQSLDQVSLLNPTPVFYEGVQYKNKAELDMMLLIEDHNKMHRYLTWGDNFPTLLLVLLTTCAFGLIGSIIGTFKDCIRNQTKVKDTRFVLQATLGFLTGFVVLGITYLIPTLIVEEAQQVRSLWLMFFGLFAGIFSLRFFDAIASFFDKLLTTK